jgi:hypothetical protein
VVIAVGRLVGSRAFRLAGLLVVVAVIFFVLGYLLVYRFIT